MKFTPSYLLPPPNYLTMPMVGVDISDTSLKYAAFSTIAPGRVGQLKHWGDTPVAAGTLERGRVLDAAKLADSLDVCRRETGAELVNVSLPEERAYLFETEIKRDTPLREVRNLLEFRLEENVPVPSRDVYFDYEFIPTSPEDEQARVLVVAYAKETVDQYYDACLAAGLFPVSFEVEAQAMARAVIPADIGGAVMLVDFGKTRTGLGIVYRGLLLNASTLEIGGEHLSQTLRKVLGDAVSETELTLFKNTHGIVSMVGKNDVRDALLGSISVIRDEIALRMQYWHERVSEYPDRQITTIIMCGGSSNLRGLTSYFSQTLGVTCVQANVWENIASFDDVIPPIDRKHSLGYATALGLALRRVV